MKQAFIYIHPDQPLSMDWLLSDSDGAVELGSGPLDALAPLCLGRQIIAFVPGDQILLTHVDLDVRPLSKLRKAVPYALEESLSEDVENLHFALGASHEGRTAVAVIRRTLIERWSDELAQHGLQARFAVPDLLQLPWQANTWSLLVSAKRVLVRLGEHEGFVSEREGLEELLMAVLDSHELPEKILLWYCGENHRPLKWADSAPPVEQQVCDRGVLGVLSHAWDFRPSINLLQGALSSEPEVGKLLRPWRWAAALAALWFCISLTAQYVERHQLRGQLATMQQQMEDIYRQTFPGSNKVVNPRVQMEQQLKTLQGGAGSGADDFIVLLSNVAEPLAKNDKTTLESLNYRSNRLTLQLSAANLSALDELKNQIAEQTGLKAELASADSGAGKASGQIRIQTP